MKEIPPSDNVRLYFLWSRSSFGLKLRNGLRAELLGTDFDRSTDFPNTFWFLRGVAFRMTSASCVPASFFATAPLSHYAGSFRMVLLLEQFVVDFERAKDMPYSP